MTQRSDPWLGKTIGGRYRILRKLAEGGMGAVYEAEQVALHRKVAIKLLHEHLARHEDIVERFRREALAATAIGHPHIVEVLDFGDVEDGTVFMAMELLDGHDLGHLVKTDGPLPIGRTVRIAQQIARALAAAHGKGIVHRDLKPENVVLIARDGEPDFAKILDFGISKLQQAIDGVAEPSATRTGTTLGTPHYMAPEQAQARKDLDHRVDVYALGVILFRVLTGQHPFDDDSYPMLVLKICTDPPPSVRLFRGDVPVALERAIERMLAKDPKDRFASMHEIDAVLAPFVTHDAPPVLLSAPATSQNRARVLSGDGKAHDAHARTQALAAAETDDEEEIGPTPGARPFPKWIVGLLAIGLVALGAVAVQSMTGDDPIEPEGPLPELPTPRAPIARPMVGAVRGGLGWTWVNPIPRAMPTWFGVDVASGGEPVVMVGERGTAVRYEGGSLYGWRTGTDAPLRAVEWTGAREALAVGDGGTVVRLTSERPIAIGSGVEDDLRAIAAVSSTEAIVVGDRGVVLRVRGEDVARVNVRADVDLLGVHVREGSAFLVGDRGTVLRLTGTEVVREISGVDVALRSIAGCPDGDLYAVGDEGTVVRRRRQSGWTQVRTTGNEAFTAVSCDHGRIAAVRRDGEVWLFSGDRSIQLPSGFDRPWHAAAGGTRGSTWLVGAGGRLATIEEDHVRTRTAGPTMPIRALGGMGGALVAVGEWGRILIERERGLEAMESPTDSGLAALLQVDEGRLLAIGDFGVIVDIRFDSATLLPSPARSSLRAGVIDPGTRELLIVGANGQLLRGDVDALTSSVVPDVGDLWSVTGTPSDAIAVGDGGAVLHMHAAGFARVPCAAQVTLRSVIRTDEGTWAVGDEGRIVRIEGNTGCTEERSGGPPLHVIGRGPDGKLIAGGDDGVVLFRGDDGRWREVDVDVGAQSVRAIWRNGRDVWLAGTGGVLVRHIRVDGE